MGNQKKNSNIMLAILIIALVVLFILSLIIIITLTRKSLNKNIGLAKLEATDDTQDYFTCDVYDNKDTTNMKALIRVNRLNGLEYIEYPDGNKIYCNGKTNLGFDYRFSEGDTYIFKIKTIDGSIEEKQIIANEDILPVSIKRLESGDGYQTIEVGGNINLTGYEYSYKWGKEGKWNKSTGIGQFSFLDYDISDSEYMDEDKTITVEAEAKNINTGNKVKISKKYDIDTTSTIRSFRADSLIDAIEKYDYGTGLFSIRVKDEEYNLRVYSFDQNLNVTSTTPEFGREEDCRNSKGICTKYGSIKSKRKSNNTK